MASASSVSAQRRKARHYAMQALYQWQMSGSKPSVIEAEFRTDNDMTHVDRDYFHDILSNTPRQVSELDSQIESVLQDKALHELDPISLALLRMASYEFSARLDVPYKVVINEAIALAKKFGPTDAYKFINGTLDKLAASLRKAEVAAENK
jgi:transcription antitermination protein NusB